MLKVAELQNIELLKNFRLAAGGDGLDKRITNTTILEYEPYTNGYQVFKTGDFILTSLFFAKDNPDLILESVQALLDKDIAGLAVKTTIFTEIPENVIAFCDEHKLPLFMFEDTYMEDIITVVNGIVKYKENTELIEQELMQFIHNDNKLATVQFANRIAYFPYGWYFVAYLEESPEATRNSQLSGEGQTSTPSDTENPDQLYYHWAEQKGNLRSTLIRCGDGILMIYSFSEKEKEKLNAIHVIGREMERVHLDRTRFVCGVSRLQGNLVGFRQAIDQAMDACRIAKAQQREWTSYDAIGVYKWIMPMTKDATVMEAYDRFVTTLKAYDEKFASELFKTLEIYIRCQGKISATAKELYQHTNTIRYRLEKAQELLQLEDFYETAYLMIHIYWIM